MSTLVIFFSFTCNVKKMAQEMAEAKGAALVEVKPEVLPSKMGAIMKSYIGDMDKKDWPIKPLGVDLNDFEHIIIMCPVWNYKPAPYMNNVLNSLPQGKSVEFHMVSAGGVTKNKDQVVAKVKQAGCNVVGWHEISLNMTPVGSIGYVMFKATLNK